MNRPYPPIALVGVDDPAAGDRFEPSEDLREWVFDSFINGDGPLVNPDHNHLNEASIGFLWTNCGNSRNMRRVLGQAELMPPMAMGKWQRARAVQQIEEWFGEVPDFLITLDAIACTGMSDASFCALIEHELYHCGQSIDVFGMPKFKTDGMPSFAIRGHDVEEFIGVVRRYGSDAAKVDGLIEAANAKPLLDGADVDGICGTCALKAA